MNYLSFAILFSILSLTACTDPLAETSKTSPLTREAKNKSDDLDHQMAKLEQLKKETIPQISKPKNRDGDVIEWLLPGGRGIQVLYGSLEESLLSTLEGKRKQDKRFHTFDRLAFGSGSAILSKSSYAQIKVVAKILRAFPKFIYLIRGHTDSSGSAKTNKILSFKRANSVKQKLIEYGAPRQVIQTRGLGPAEPIADNISPEGRQKNRRIDISVMRP